jgi:hypothetical protein
MLLVVQVEIPALLILQDPLLLMVESEDSVPTEEEQAELREQF